MAAAKEFNIGTSTLVDFLVTKGFSSDDLKPTSKLSEPMYRVLQSEFQQDKVQHEKAMQIDLPKGASASDVKKKKDEQQKKKDQPKMTKQQVQQLLQALQEQEKKLQQKMQKMKIPSPSQPEKDW